MILASTKPTVLTTNLEYRYYVIISISNPENHDQNIETLHFNPQTLKLKQNKVILSKTSINFESYNFSADLAEQSLFNHCYKPIIAPPPRILRLKPTTILSEISQLDEEIHWFPLQCFE